MIQVQKTSLHSVGSGNVVGVNHWNKLPRREVNSLSLDISK